MSIHIFDIVANYHIPMPCKNALNQSDNKFPLKIGLMNCIEYIHELRRTKYLKSLQVPLS